MLKNAKPKVIFALIFLVFLTGIFLRIQYLKKTTVYHPRKTDAQEYVNYGYNLWYNGIYSRTLSSDPPPSPDSFRPPGYPLLIALAIKLGGLKNFEPIIIYTQVFFSSIMIFVAYYLGAQFLSQCGSISAAILVALSPHMVSMTGYVLTETIFGFTLLTSLFCFTEALKRRYLILFICSSFLFGYSYLVNETAFFIPFLLIFPILFFNKTKDNSVKKIAVFIIVFSLFPICWSMRNEISLPSNAAKGSQRAVKTMTHGSYPGFIYKDPDFKYYPYQEDPMQPHFGSSFGNFISILWERFKERPIRYLSWYIFEKPYYLWSWDNLQSQKGGNPGKGQGDIYVYRVKHSLYHTSSLANASRILMKYLHPVILVLALLGIPLFIINIVSWKQDEALFQNTPVFLFIILIYYTFLYTIFAPWPRYSVPLRPELYLFAIWSFQTLKNTYFGKFLSGLNITK